MESAAVWAVKQAREDREEKMAAVSVSDAAKIHGAETVKCAEAAVGKAAGVVNGASGARRVKRAGSPEAAVGKAAEMSAVAAVGKAARHTREAGKVHVDRRDQVPSVSWCRSDDALEGRRGTCSVEIVKSTCEENGDAKECGRKVTGEAGGVLEEHRGCPEGTNVEARVSRSDAGESGREVRPSVTVMEACEVNQDGGAEGERVTRSTLAPKLPIRWVMLREEARKFPAVRREESVGMHVSGAGPLKRPPARDHAVSVKMASTQQEAPVVTSTGDKAQGEERRRVAVAWRDTGLRAFPQGPLMAIRNDLTDEERMILACPRCGDFLPVMHWKTECPRCVVAAVNMWSWIPRPPSPGMAAVLEKLQPEVEIEEIYEAVSETTVPRVVEESPQLRPPRTLEVKVEGPGAEEEPSARGVEPVDPPSQSGEGAPLVLQVTDEVPLGEGETLDFDMKEDVLCPYCEVSKPARDWNRKNPSARYRSVIVSVGPWKMGCPWDPVA